MLEINTPRESERRNTFGHLGSSDVTNPPQEQRAERVSPLVALRIHFLLLSLIIGFLAASWTQR